MPDKTKEELLDRFQNTPQEEFIGLLIHDARGPLSGIISAAKLMRSLVNEDGQIDSEQFEQLVGLVLQSSNNLRTVFEAAIDYDRIQRGIPLDEDDD